MRSAYVLLGNSRLFSRASFRNVYTAFLLVIAGSTDRELARQVNYLKAENQILRSRLPGRISLTEREKNHLGELKKLGIESVTRNTVKNILKRNGFESGPIESTKTGGPKCKILMIDNDAKYSKLFMNGFEKEKIKTQRTPIRSPNMDAFAERFVETIKRECLDHFVVFGHKHMDLPCQEFKDYYHEERPQQGLENELVIKGSRTKRLSKSGAKRSEIVSIPISEIRCKERLGGLLKSYSRKAA